MSPSPEEVSYAVPLSEAARYLGVTVRTVQNYVARGVIAPFYLPGSGRPRIPMSEINRVRRATTRDAALAKATPLDRFNRARKHESERK
ncbi:MAG: helix-turn-helix domain-containing protein [Planctomycetales bacterium]|nr:helix-turn-helix domain-containing protein [Planctomycetales bacterium]